VDIVLNDDGDIDVTDFVGPRLFDSSETSEHLKQRILITLRTFLGEWFLDANIGVPWLQQIIGAKGERGRALAATLVRDAVRRVPGVLSVDEVVVDFVGRETRLSLVARTSAGAIALATTEVLP
jgi:hypothetical protein